jgi:RNA polymerase sigma-70 factor (ECF subfamily)
VAALVNLDADRSAVEATRRDPRAFEALYRKYVAQVYNFALYELRDPHAAEDLTAQVFLRALSGLRHFREQSDGPGSSFRVWLFQIARNSLSNERRRRGRHPEAPLDAALELPAADNVHESAAARAELQAALAAIEALPADRRRALVLRFVNELDAREIGQVLGRSEGATRVLIHRSLRAVARSIGRDGTRRAAAVVERRRAAN